MDVEAEDNALERYLVQMEREEERECAEAREALHFMRYMANVRLDERDMAQLGARAGNNKALMDEAQYIAEYVARHAEYNRPFVLKRPERDYVTVDDRQKELITVRPSTPGSSDLILMAENLVYVTYFCDQYTKRRCEFVLEALGIALGPCGVELSTSKFAKITLRHLYGPSHLFFASGALLETGTYNPIIARKSLNHTIQLLRELGGYRNIEVGKRTCQNIVAKGTLDFELCLLVLRANYPKCVTYKCRRFVGAIIRLQKKRRVRPLTYGGGGGDDDDSMMQVIDSRGQAGLDDVEAEAEDAAGEEDDEDEEYEYLEVGNNDQIYNAGFDYYNNTAAVPDAEARDNRDLTEPLAQLRALDPDSDEAHALEECLVRGRAAEMRALDAIAAAAASAPSRDLGIYKEDEIDETDLAQVANKNVTVIVFGKGRVIIAGCKTTRETRRAGASVLPMLESARKTKANMDKEKKLERKESSSFIVVTTATQ